MLRGKPEKKLDYSLCLLSAVDGGKNYGCIVNSFHQVDSSFPAKFTVTVNRDNATNAAVLNSGVFCVTLLGDSCPADVINTFGYKSGKVTDKFAGLAVETDSLGNSYIKGGMVGRISCRVIDKIDIGNYTLYVAQLVNSEEFSDEKVLTLKSFTDRGKSTPPTASVYRTVEMNGYRCTVCGYVHEAESLPDDFVCPLCRATADKFEKI